jgi:chromosome segregation ATPase
MKLEEKTARNAILESPEEVKKIAENHIRYKKGDFKIILVFYEFKKSGLSGKEFIAKHQDWFSKENDDIILEHGIDKLEKYTYTKSNQLSVRETFLSQKNKELDQKIIEYKEKIDALQSQLSALQSQLSALQSDLGELQSQLEEKQLQTNSITYELSKSKSECEGLKEVNKELQEKFQKTQSLFQVYKDNTNRNIDEFKQNQEKMKKEIKDKNEIIQMYKQSLQNMTENKNATFEARKKRDIEYQSEMNKLSNQNFSENPENSDLDQTQTPNKKPKK